MTKKEDNLQKGRRFRSGDEATKTAAQRGGIASGAARRKRKTTRRAIEEIFSESLPRSDQTDELLQKYGLDGNADGQTLVLMGLTLRAARGDAKAATLLFDLLGEGAEAKRADARLRLDKERTKLLREDIRRKAGKIDEDGLPIIQSFRPVRDSESSGGENDT